MTVFGLTETDVATHIRSVAGDQHSNEQLFARFAHAAWSFIAEPGDRISGELTAALGVRGALETIIAREDAAAIARRVGAAVTEREVADALARWYPRLQSQLILRAIAQASRFGVHLTVPDDDVWPESLDDLGPHAPHALWVRGRLETLAASAPSMALVGARAATGYGEHMAMEASAGLVDRGYTIVSGAAYGIDGMAHRAALASSGQTIAVLAGGVDRLYPSGHEALLNRIVDEGAVVSEVPCGTAPTKWRFLQRNRIIAALSLATVVLEAGWRSGSLNTAGHALSLGRPLGAVPGPVTSAASAGCHRLIRELDAALVTTAAEMAELAPLPQHTTHSAPIGVNEDSEGRSAAQDPDAVRVLDAMSARSARDVGDVASRSGLAIATVQSVLGRLELEAAVCEREDGWVRASAPSTRG
ncbi:MAG: DNA-processing protein DprA [Cryobacterium sp.]|nr:DNA-processing protein DprA [Cryobacterium sp.]